MERIDIHHQIKETLDYFIEHKQVPNLLFYGPHGSGKRTIVYDFINKIYDGRKDILKTYVLYANCAHGKGIKFIREDLKFFAKTHIQIEGSGYFKTVVLLNADQLTIDAQSALRRCIELFSHSTRFFVVVEDKYRLLKPILSRFCEIYVKQPVLSLDTKSSNKQPISLYKYQINSTFGNDFLNHQKQHRFKLIQRILKQHNLYPLPLQSHPQTKTTNNDTQDITIHILSCVEELYQNGYSGIDLLEFLREKIKDKQKDEFIYKCFVQCEHAKCDFRNELLWMTYIFTLFFIPQMNEMA
jgi:hypothetical protein